MVTLAVEASLAQVPSVTAAEAARVLGVSTARIAQLCKAGYLDSWKIGGTRMVSIESRIESEPAGGRPKREHTAV
ncbi:MAG: helix-turn-helix domain-containing protein [Atopobiaceae bacterium]|nr:helix-turn-helix domain-containing protein [Atopobiaceae bacterium]